MSTSRFVRRGALLFPFCALGLATPALAQGPAFQSPGMLQRATLGQTTRFSTEFNPAFGFVVDGVADWLDLDGDDDGFDANIRLVEFNAAAYLDPNAWGYLVYVSDGLEAPEIEEAAVELIGLGDRTSVRVGRFFVDFGKQMQSHLEELRTVERPLVLREYLGDELGGTGAQFDTWIPVGEATPVRMSVGVFGSLVGEAEEEDDGGPLLFEPATKDLDELSITARLTSLHELSDASTLQLGASARLIPEFGIQDDASGLALEGLSNNVYGLDLTYGWTNDTGNRTVTAGLEWLLTDGDQGATLDDGGTPGDPSDDSLVALDDSANGFYAFADYGWTPNDAAGVQYSSAELPSADGARAEEFELYYTRWFTEFRRLRFGASHFDLDGGNDEARLYVQFTAYLGSHAHGINW